MIYMDYAATSIHKPEVVLEAVEKAMRSMGNPGRGVHEASLCAARSIYETRVRIAELFGAESPSCIAFTMNATESLNIAIKGILEAGDHVITTAMEHNSVLRPLYVMEQRGIELTILPCDKNGNVDQKELEKAIRGNTKALICTHGSNLTGNLNDLKSLGKLASENHILFVVDASQTAGVFPIDVQEMKIDILCFTGHKSLLGPQGTGGLYVRNNVQVRPLLSGGSGIQTYSKVHPAEMPTALEAGTLNSHGLAGLCASIQWIEETGMSIIREKEQKLMWTFYQEVVKIPGVVVYGDFSGKERCPIVTLNIRDYDSGQVSDALYMDYGIAVRAGGHCAPLMHEALGTKEQGAVRFSFSYENTMEEIKTAVLAIKELAAL